MESAEVWRGNGGAVEGAGGGGVGAEGTLDRGLAEGAQIEGQGIGMEQHNYHVRVLSGVRFSANVLDHFRQDLHHLLLHDLLNDLHNLLHRPLHDVHAHLNDLKTKHC